MPLNNTFIIYTDKEVTSIESLDELLNRYEEQHNFASIHLVCDMVGSDIRWYDSYELAEMLDAKLVEARAEMRHNNSLKYSGG